MGLVACALVVVTFAFTRGADGEAWKQGFLAGIAMAMATLPEEFPVVLTVFLALGAWRISRSQVLTRRMPAVETLGAATVLCVDKTGTLTQNRMTVRKLATPTGAVDLFVGNEVPGDYHDLLENAILASHRNPFDPMEHALHEAGDSAIGNSEHLHPAWLLVKEYPLTPGLLTVSHAWTTGNGGEVVVAAKGAPEAIADLCRLDANQQGMLAREVTRLASEGLRVLGVARAVTRLPDLPSAQHDLALSFVGLIGFEDPLRPSVPAASRPSARPPGFASS